MGYTKATTYGVSWITLLRVITRLLTFLRLAILGRLLNPTQFGYFGVASLILALLEILTETGINIFLVQRNDIKSFINSAWVVSILRGFILGILIIVLSPFVATFFNATDAVFVILLIALVPIIRGFINPAIVTYQKDLFFNLEFKLRSTLFAVDVIVTILFAFLLRDASSFVFGLIASALLEVLLSFYLFKLRPKFEIDFNKVKLIIKKGWWVTITGIFLYFADNGDNLTIGKILGSSFLGIYQVAYKFSTLPISEIAIAINQVIFPVYSKFAKDKKRLLNAFIKVFFATSFASVVLGVLVFVFAETIIRVFMGDQWLSAVPVIKILAVYGILRGIFGNFPPLFLACQRQDLVAKMTFVRAFALAVFIIPLVVQFGMMGAGYAMLISMFFEVPVILLFSLKVLRS